ncbi:PREDICTED: brain-specific angiogenesis inhibitor 1-like [Acropora digitifera]|uniref:brain-specific angiogenesis inhibitor 1-like n=1 Tax=Acropora digitifera TaxID=70779 RepID=UPI00077A77AA|nr:PREDICTED: brain-specific angiogenesis inhibitor 1-like [Acropora digitifera]
MIETGRETLQDLAIIKVEAITRGYQSNTRVGEVLSGLVNATQPITNDTTRPSQIYGGDLLVSVKILVRLAEYNNASQGKISSEEDVHNFATVVSNLLDPGNTITWQNLEQEGKGRSRTLIKAVDSYGLGVAATLNRTTKPRRVETKNLLMKITRVTRDRLVKNEGLKVSYQKSSIQLPSEAFGSNYSHVVSVIYLTLNDVISLRRGKYENVTSLPNTTVVSSTVFPPPQKNFIEPVKIVLENKRVSVPSGAALKTTCVFWRPGGSSLWETRGCELVPSESDTKKTTCKCDHLTIFASLMDPIDSNVGEAHREALEMISIVGCSISLIAVLVTIAVSLIFWRAIKSPRAKVLLNLCIAIALSCIFVISEGFARDNKVFIA